MLGNSLNQSVPVASLYGDVTLVRSVWVWNGSGWLFYSPTLDAASLQNYAASKGYSVLSTLAPGQGYWIDATTAHTLPVQQGKAYTVSPASVSKGWNMIASGSAITPALLNLSLGTAGAASPNINSLWTWDNPTSTWYFYDPALDAQGGTALADYIASRGFVAFGQQSIQQGTGNLGIRTSA